ncbi:MAG: ATP-binding protein [Chloroflexaceae bacterium]|nr:ATP-binding protein [Chloroflexaceae bacterium]
MPTPRAVRLLADLFDDTQAGRTYWMLAQKTEHWQALHTLGLTDGVICSDFSRPTGALREPARFVGVNLFRRLAAIRSPEGRLSAQRLIQAFLDDHPPAPLPAETRPGCLMINLSLLGARNDWYNPLLLLPWEALTEPERPAPLQIERPIVIVRTIAADPYQPPEELNLEQPAPMLALLPHKAITPEIRAAERRARPYAPRRHRQELVWCDCPKPRPGVRRAHLRTIFERHAPAALHYFGHGAFWPLDPGRLINALQIDDALLGALELATQTHDCPIWLFCCFACHSGTPGDQSEQPLTSERWSIINTFSGSVPAMLMMTIAISAAAAGVAGEAWYAALARGATLLQAAHQMRRALWQHALHQQGHWSADRHAWWIPALYLRHPCWDRALVNHTAWQRRLQPPGQYYPPNREQQEHIKTIFERLEHSRYRVVNVHGPTPQTSRTTLLHQIAARLRAERKGHLLLSAPGDGQPGGVDRLALLKNVIITRLRQARGLHAHWDGQSLKRAMSDHPDSEDLHRRYVAALKAHRRKPFWVLIDDIDWPGEPQSQDGRKPFPGLSLLPLNECGETQVRFIVTTRNPEFGRQLYMNVLKLEADETISIPRLFTQPRPYLHSADAFTEWFIQRKGQLAYRLLAVLLIADQALHETTLRAYCEMQTLGEDTDVAKALQHLKEEELAAYDGQRYQARLDSTLVRHWAGDEGTAPIRAEIRAWFKRWYERVARETLRKQHNVLPEDLLRLILKRSLFETPSRYEIADYNFDETADRDNALYRWWLILLESAARYGLEASLADYVADLARSDTPYTACDRKLLNYLECWLRGTASRGAFGPLMEESLDAVHRRDPKNHTQIGAFFNALRSLRTVFERSSEHQ